MGCIVNGVPSLCVCVCESLNISILFGCVPSPFNRVCHVENKKQLIFKLLYYDKLITNNIVKNGVLTCS